MKRKPAKRKAPLVMYTQSPHSPEVGNNTCSHCGVHLALSVFGFLCPHCNDAYLVWHVPHAMRRRHA